LKERSPAVSKRTIDFACFWHCVTGCVKERPLLAVVKCFFQELTKCCRASRIRTQQG
jgi:hypothetical protein